jgi:hypothetical protein
MYYYTGDSFGKHFVILLFELLHKMRPLHNRYFSHYEE